MRCKNFIILFFLAASFYFATNAKAADVLDIQQTTTSNYLYWSDGWRAFGQRFVANQNNISKIYIWWNTGTSTVSICKGIPADNSASDMLANASTCNWAGNTLIHSEILSDAGHTGTFIFNAPVALDVGDDYYFTFTPDAYISVLAGYWANNYGGLVIGGEPNASGLTFQTYYSDSYTPPPSAPQFTIQILTPATTTPFTTYYSQPASFTFNYLNPINWFYQIIFDVKRKADARAAAWPDYVRASVFNIPSGTGTTTLAFGTSLFHIPDGYYDLDVYFNNGGWTASPVHATTTFTINSGGTYGGYSFATSTLLTPPTFSTADLCGDIATTTTFGAIECGLIKAFVGTITWAFAPSFDTLTNFKVSFELFKGCFPFNTYFQLTDTITNAASSTASSTAGTIKIPFIHTLTGGGTFYMLDAVSSSTLSNWIGETNYNLFRTTIGYFFWLIAAAVVFFTVKYI